MKMTVEVNLLERVVGVPEELKVEGIKTSEPLMVSVGTATTVGVVTSARENRADMALKIPVVAENGQRVAVSRRIGGKGGADARARLRRTGTQAPLRS